MVSVEYWRVQVWVICLSAVSVQVTANCNREARKSRMGVVVEGTGCSWTEVTRVVSGRALPEFSAFVCLAEGDVAADGDGVAGIAVLGDQDPMAALLYGVLADHVHGDIEVVFNGVRVVGGDF